MVSSLGGFQMKSLEFFRATTKALLKTSLGIENELGRPSLAQAQGAQKTIAKSCHVASKLCCT